MSAAEDLRARLIAYACDRSRVAIHSTHRGVPCVACGIVTGVLASHVTIEFSRSGSDTILPLSAITRVDLLSRLPKREPDESEEPAT